MNRWNLAWLIGIPAFIVFGATFSYIAPISRAQEQDYELIHLIAEVLGEVDASYVRELDPDLDLWKTAKPYLERWIGEQVGLQGLFERFKAEAPRYLPGSVVEVGKARVGRFGGEINLMHVSVKQSIDGTPLEVVRIPWLNQILIKIRQPIFIQWNL